jgi:hypothetical protein
VVTSALIADKAMQNMSDVVQYLPRHYHGAGASRITMHR